MEAVSGIARRTGQEDSNATRVNYYRLKHIRRKDGSLHFVGKEPVIKRASSGGTGEVIRDPIQPENFHVQEYFDSMTPVPRDLPPIEVKFSAVAAGSREDLRT